MGSRSRLRKTQPSNSRYIKQLPLLLLAGLCFFWLLRVVTTQDPTQVANWLLQQSYLVLIFPFFLFTTFLTGYLTLDLKQGSLIGLSLTLLLLFRVQQIQFEFGWLALYFVATVVVLIINKKLNHIKPNSPES